MAFLPWRQKLTGAITTLTNGAARFVRPVLPWIFLAVRRAWIPSLVSLVLAVLFFLVPQSREVLHGLSEPRLASMSQFDAADRSSVNGWALSSYVITAVLLGLAIWYTARLLCTVDAQRGRPLALTTAEASARLDRAATWYPRGLGVGALAAAVGALIHATYAPHYAWPVAAVLLAVLAIGAPLVVVTGHLRARRGRPPAWLRWVCLACALGWVASVALLVYLHPKWAMWAWCVGGSLLPAALLLFLFYRRRLLERWAHSASGGPHRAAADRSFAEVIVTIVVLVLLSASVLLLLALLPPAAMRYFGSAAAILMFLVAAALLSTGVQLLLWRVASEVPGFTTACTLTVTVLVALVGKEDLGTEKLAPPQASGSPPPASGITDMAATAPGPLPPSAGFGPSRRVEPPQGFASAPAPALFVNAYGGGLRAALFTAQVLARTDDATCGRFGQRVAAFSGVSGGSLGLAVYLLARQELQAANRWQPCAQSPADAPADQPLTRIVERTLVQDHLSPVISRMLAVDAPHLWGSPVRGQALLDSWHSALRTALAEELKQDENHYAALALPLSQLTGGFRTVPGVFFNATDADSGHIVWFSNWDGGRVNTHDRSPQVVPLSVGQAVLHSARFPIVSPAGELKFPEPLPRTARLVDGGYADNSGTMTLLDIKGWDRPGWGPAQAHRLIDIDGNPGEQPVCNQGPEPTPPLITAVRALFQVRSAHATRAVEQFKARTSEPAITVQLDLKKAYTEPGRDERVVCDMVRRAQEAPLGWYMSYGAAAELTKSVEVGVKQLCQALALECKPLPTAMAQR